MSECFEVPPALQTSAYHAVDAAEGVGRQVQHDGASARPGLLRRAQGQDLRQAFRRQASSVFVVTVNTPTGPVGFTATSVTSVCVEPPMLSFNLSRTSSSWPAVSTATHVGVHLLAADQEPLASRFATSGIDRFDGTAWAPGPHRVPVLADVSAVLLAAIDERIPAGDQAVVIARVLHVDVDDEPTAPLLYHDGHFHGGRRPLLRILRGRRVG